MENGPGAFAVDKEDIIHDGRAGMTEGRKELDERKVTPFLTVGAR